MLLVREVLQCKPGKVGEMKKKFLALSGVCERLGYPRFRLLTDVCGEPFWTLVAEMEAESLDAYLALEERVMQENDARQALAGYHDLLSHGRREVLRIES